MRRTSDHRPGRLPEIHSDGTSLTFAFDIPTYGAPTQLVLRCDEDGTICARLQGILEATEGNQGSPRRSN
jgi:hypothetical protein